ncbi:methylthioribulose-1-phosphate dehydratase [Bacterioplanes sanyensis]|uniref:Methylthioribulose-1-phosphate dehydratase n=1 Tax=Bacterioplanes sanyensis TaxID=1249553 RepID=A0A222FNW3_9GAMM|nr:methylthioribulose 1-phosphate dehydratase [Bacterioplanes sanyensis]ASP40715.1 methylthioribulose-1-phosphate dehydratase [Bacterioplanes sanyensis]
MDVSTLAQQLCDVSRRIYQRDWSPATSSNYSVRLDQQRCLITTSGRDKGQLQVDQLMQVDLHNQALTAGKPSAETALHTQLYRDIDGIGAVLHTHSQYAVMLSRMVGADELHIEGWELQKALAGQHTHEATIHIPIFANSQDIDLLAQQVSQRLDSQHHAPCYLIRGHGVYTWGQDLDECFRHLEALEHLFRYEFEWRRMARGDQS